jgi:hypothetical protein
LRALTRACDEQLRGLDCVVTPTAGSIYRIAELEEEPIQLNTNIGRYTNFMNLLDLAAVAVPAGFTGGPPRRPGLVRRDTGGAAIEVEIWELGEQAFGRFVARIPAPLCIGKVTLADGTAVAGFLCESHATRDAGDITSYAGWRRYLATDGAGV